MIIEALGITKRYRAHLRREWLLMRAFQPRRSRPSRAEGTTILALDDVSLRLRRGRSLGVMGDNGAGKTTLLRILAGISEPTTGTVTVRGRVATRFGLGLAFNPYLTGRENLFLEGTLLGLTNRQVRASFDEVVDFAGLDGAIDRPLWTYSSGMVSRLGFAIATRVKSDLLLLDEALSAGDASFRERSEKALLEAREHGRSLVVVSHGLALVRRLCDEGLWLDHGRVHATGPIDEVADAYESAKGVRSSRESAQRAAVEADAG